MDQGAEEMTLADATARWMHALNSDHRGLAASSHKLASLKAVFLVSNCKSCLICSLLQSAYSTA
jgi:hypothetical protein